MTEFRRDKILPEDLIQRTNLSQHNMMIDAINDIDGRQGDIERITNVNIDDITDLKTDVIALSNEKLDKADIDADLHFGDITVTRDGTAVIMSLDVLNPTTGVVTPISFTIPGATTAEAGTMDASSVAWIADAEERISALEGLSDVKAVADLPGTPTQAQLTTGWVAVADKSPETGDILQDINNSKLWVFVTDTWVLYGTIVPVPLATTSTIGGVRDTSLTAPGNRWYVHVEADGRLSLIGGDSLSTLLDTTIPGIQTAVNNSVKKTGDETIGGIKTFTALIRQERAGEAIIRFKNTDKSGKEGEITTGANMLALMGYDSNNRDIGSFRLGNNMDFSFVVMAAKRIMADDSVVEGNIRIRVFSDGSAVALGITPPASASGIEIPTAAWTISKLTSKQDKLTFDSVPTTGSANPVTSGGVYTALDAKASKVEVSDGLALKVDKGSTITASDGVVVVNDITSHFWRPCGNSDVTNFVSVMTSSQYLYCYISPDGNQTSYTVCKSTDVLDNGGYTSYTMMVPKNWYYKIDFSSVPNIICSVVEQPILL